MDPADLDSPRRELFICGLGFIVAFWFVGKLILPRLVLDVQSSCTAVERKDTA